MGAELFKICGIAVLCAVAGIVVGGAVGGVNTALKMAGLALVLGGAVTVLSEIVSDTSAIGVGDKVGEYASLMLKGLGISALCRICSDICRDCGQATVASAVESVGKLFMVALAMPIVVQILEYAEVLLDKI